MLFQFDKNSKNSIAFLSVYKWNIDNDVVRKKYYASAYLCGDAVCAADLPARAWPDHVLLALERPPPPLVLPGPLAPHGRQQNHYHHHQAAQAASDHQRHQVLRVETLLNHILLGGNEKCFIIIFILMHVISASEQEWFYLYWLM